MSGGYEAEPRQREPAEDTKKIMTDYKVDEETAVRIAAYCNTVALEKMKKWTSNMRKRQKEKAEEIYQLTKRLKRDNCNTLVVNEIEKKILELCVEHE